LLRDKGAVHLGLVVEEEEGHLGLVLWSSLYDYASPTVPGVSTFKLDRQETGATEVQVSSLDLGWAVLLFILSPGRIAY
jgi:hypothetical protein